MLTAALSPPRLYLPFSDGRYTVTARLKALGDEPHFQVDARYLEYVAGKLALHRRDPARAYRRAGVAPELERAVIGFALETLAGCYPAVFALEQDGPAAHFTNHALGLELALDLDTLRVERAARVPARWPGADAGLDGLGGANVDAHMGGLAWAKLDALVDGVAWAGLDALAAVALQTQEDWALLARDAQGDDLTVALHVTYPSHWRPEDKIGRSFIDVHRPVAGVEPLLKAAPSLVEVMIHKGPWERFTWTLPRTPDLDEHLEALAARPVPGVPRAEEVGERCWLRVERQVVQGFPAAHGALFMIRLHIVPLAEVVRTPGAAAALAAAVRSTTPASLAYKGLADWHEPLLAYLEGLTTR